jgi:NADH dehydrogenase [ubiquinone] 1 alpha subcomplex assembly factor 8
MPPRVRPIEKFAKAAGQCSAKVHTKSAYPQETKPLTSSQASVYGKCIVVDFNHVHKDKCLKEFLQLKECFLVRKICYRIIHVKKCKLTLSSLGGVKEDLKRLKNSYCNFVHLLEKMANGVKHILFKRSFLQNLWSFSLYV